ncbi:hypothetical protein DAMA08_038180 [Martiniozyma asiatica (nom. inval.)]|nr:hypothetical protein DAMA08_038180 [Martiniozyma asiatica]
MMDHPKLIIRKHNLKKSSKDVNFFYLPTKIITCILPLDNDLVLLGSNDLIILNCSTAKFQRIKLESITTHLNTETVISAMMLDEKKNMVTLATESRMCINVPLELIKSNCQSLTTEHFLSPVVIKYLYPICNDKYFALGFNDYSQEILFSTVNGKDQCLTQNIFPTGFSALHENSVAVTDGYESIIKIPRILDLKDVSIPGFDWKYDEIIGFLGDKLLVNDKRGGQYSYRSYKLLDGVWCKDSNFELNQFIKQKNCQIESEWEQNSKLVAVCGNALFTERSLYYFTKDSNVTWLPLGLYDISNKTAIHLYLKGGFLTLQILQPQRETILESNIPCKSLHGAFFKILKGDSLQALLVCSSGSYIFTCGKKLEYIQLPPFETGLNYPILDVAKFEKTLYILTTKHLLSFKNSKYSMRTNNANIFKLIPQNILLGISRNGIKVLMDDDWVKISDFFGGKNSENSNFDVGNILDVKHSFRGFWIIGSKNIIEISNNLSIYDVKVSGVVEFLGELHGLTVAHTNQEIFLISKGGSLLQNLKFNKIIQCKLEKLKNELALIVHDGSEFKCKWFKFENHKLRLLNSKFPSNSKNSLTLDQSLPILYFNGEGEALTYAYGKNSIQLLSKKSIPICTTRNSMNGNKNTEIVDNIYKSQNSRTFYNVHHLLDDYGSFVDHYYNYSVPRSFNGIAELSNCNMDGMFIPKKIITDEDYNNFLLTEDFFILEFPNL